MTSRTGINPDGSIGHWQEAVNPFEWERQALLELRRIRVRMDALQMCAGQAVSRRAMELELGGKELMGTEVVS